MTQREAVEIANRAHAQILRRQPPVRPLRLAHTQKIKDRWLVEFDTAATSYGVAVAGDGNTEISIWDKSSGVRFAGGAGQVLATAADCGGFAGPRQTRVAAVTGDYFCDHSGSRTGSPKWKPWK